MTQKLTRRRLIEASAMGLTALGASAATSASAQQAPAPAAPVPTADQLAGAERLAGVAYTEAERAQVLATISDQLEAIRVLRTIEKPNALHPAQVFNPRVAGVAYPEQRRAMATGRVDAGRVPESDDDIAFAPVWKLSRWLQARQITSRRLTDIYLARIERFNPILQCFVTVTADSARAEADAADRELSRGRARGPLHGVPYGVKDLFDAQGVKTTWGAEPWMNNPPATADSVVVARLRAAGAVLLGKTTTGALARGDVWFGGTTKNPFNPEEGSSGSSAGSSSATAGGLIGFGIGTETLGSLVSPAHRNGTTSLRPTFGRVARSGGMTLCWSLDKIGPIGRSVLDTALILSVINGGDISDVGSFDWGFDYNGNADPRGMRVGYVPAWYEGANVGDHDRAALEAARAAGVQLVEVSVPQQPISAFQQALRVEASAAFEDLTLNNTDETLAGQTNASWPNTFRTARFISGVDYVQIDRVRRKAMHDMQELFSGIEALIGPNFAGGMLVTTNFTGQPQLAFRAGFIESPARGLTGQPVEGSARKRVPMASSLWAPLFEERALIRLGRAIEARLGVAEERPTIA
jgi:Asp-tRNA(Asn)/Glu-tRNA(Gln) amidotransferase A subunit family amidase